MASRVEYTACMRPYMTGTGKTREERQEGMCIGAKLCAGKAKDTNEAKQLCAEALSKPKEPKLSSKSHRGKFNVDNIASCVLSKITDCSALNITTFSKYLSECASASGVKVKKPETKNRFLNKCVNENRVNGTFAEGISLRKKCVVKWNEKQNIKPELGDV